RIKPELEEKQRASVAKVRAERNAEAAKKALAQVESAARDGNNLMPPIVDAIRGWCTLGEISDAMRKVFGEYSPVNTV
ncbi:MAG TPA: methylmalonyl-CoA mutase family protein, partial [Candidatus Binatus sp.]|nr:methylmalonyl-CoA mutase family protein [Candidatus Binatus sp.]